MRWCRGRVVVVVVAVVVVVVVAQLIKMGRGAVSGAGGV